LEKEVPLMAQNSTTTVASGFMLPECPRWHDGALWFVDMLRGNVNRMAEGATNIVATFDRPSAVGFRPNGDMIVVEGNKCLVHTLQDGKITGSVDLSHDASHLNDMTIDHHGWAYIGARAKTSVESSNWEPTGRVVLVPFESEPRVVAENIIAPNGIGIGPDRCTLVVGESMGEGGTPTGARLLEFTIHDDGSLSDARTFATIARGAGDGLVFDAEGALWVGTAFGHEVQRFLEGEVVERVPVMDRKWALACTLGGPEMRTLFICTTAPPPKGDPSKFTDGWIETIEVAVSGFSLT
jgi:sugar lactone lactonase YvrE